MVVAADAVNLRRDERMLSAAWDSGATHELLLTKIDLDPDFEAVAEQVRSRAPGVDLVEVGSLTGVGVEAVRGALRGARTGVLL